VLLVLDEELEADECALADIADIVNEATLSAIAVIKNKDSVSIICHMGFVCNKQFKRFIAKFCTSFLLAH
jgi:hypothetical protein